jgi:omega-3 fatty acid desaturase (delta-15 desaturase)
MVVAAPPPPSVTSSPEDDNPSPFSGFDYGAKPPFTLADIRNAIPKQCWEKNTLRSLSYLARDVLVVAGLAVAAASINNWMVWPLYWLAQGTMFWALFVVGHDCGHGSFSNSKKLNDFIGHLTHSSILVPYHGWRISHRTHHANHGHVENDESWHPVTEGIFKGMDPWAKLGRLSFPIALFAFPFYLWKRSPGKEGSHYDPNCDLFTPGERNDILTSNAYLIGMLAILAAVGFTLGPAMLFKLYIVPYILNVVWLDVVTYLHHHGYEEKIPWYRGEEWNYMRGGLSTIDRDYGIFNNIHHDIGTHVVHHLFPQMPHYNLKDATEAVKPVLGEYYREPEKSKGPIPVHLIKPLVESFANDHVVPDEGDIVYYKKAF